MENGHKQASTKLAKRKGDMDGMSKTGNITT